jgi:hypothetical protein
MSDSGASRPTPEPEGEQFKYWAFLSYSHQDKDWADWLHRSLETYRIPKGMIGSETRSGRIPARLFPVFRDVEELPTSANLGQAITTALRQSRYLVVICSPRSAESRWVNEEVLTFKRLGRSGRLLCLIVDGEPNAAEKPHLGLKECFPASVRFAIGPDGELTSRRVEPIAADVRLGDPAKYDAMLKTVAGILGVGFDKLKDRDGARRKWRRIKVAASLLLFIGLAIGFAVYVKQQTDKVSRDTETVQELGRAVENMPFARMCGKYSQDEVAQLKARQDDLAAIHENIDLLAKMGMLSGFEPAKAAHDLRVAQAELAWAEGDMITARNRLESAAIEAEKYMKIASVQYEYQRITKQAFLAARDAQTVSATALGRMRRILDAGAGGEGNK